MSLIVCDLQQPTQDVNGDFADKIEQSAGIELKSAGGQELPAEAKEPKPTYQNEGVSFPLLDTMPEA